MAELDFTQLKTAGEFEDRYSEFGDPAKFDCDGEHCLINGRSVKQ